MFLLVPAHPASLGQRTVKRLLLLLFCPCVYMLHVYKRLWNCNLIRNSVSNAERWKLTHQKQMKKHQLLRMSLFVFECMCHDIESVYLAWSLFAISGVGDGLLSSCDWCLPFLVPMFFFLILCKFFNTKCDVWNCSDYTLFDVLPDVGHSTLLTKQFFNHKPLYIVINLMLFPP